MEETGGADLHHVTVAVEGELMLLFLIRVGRVVVVISAVLTIIGATVIGWNYGMAIDLYRYGYSNPYAVTPNRLGLAVVGAAIGVLVAGSVYGAIAALFEMHRHLRNLDPTVQRAANSIEHAPATLRTEPRLI